MMERALKERILGACVLVVFVVLVVPIFLDGPSGTTEVVTERVLLPGQEAQDTKTVVLEREREVPIPAAVSGTEREMPAVVAEKEPVAPTLKSELEEPSNVTLQRATPEPTPVEPVRESAEVPQVATSPVSTSSLWAVQIGSFSSKENAETLAANLRKQGYAAFLSQLNQGGKALHRVRIGPQKDRAGAEAMAERLKKVGQSGQVVPHP